MNEKIINQENKIEINNKNINEKINKKIEEIENKFNVDLNDKINILLGLLITYFNERGQKLEVQICQYTLKY